jgi:hypothetical protein
VIEPLAAKFREPAAGGDFEKTGGAIDGMRGTSFDLETNRLWAGRGGNTESGNARDHDHETLPGPPADGRAACKTPIPHRILRF